MSPEIFPIAIFGTVLLVGIVLMAPRESAIQARLRAYGYNVQANNTSGSLAERILFPAIGRLAGLIGQLSPMEVDAALRLRLAQAGRPFRLTASTFQIVRVAFVCALVLAIDGPAIRTGQFDLRSIAFGVIAVFIGWRAPMAWLSFRVDARVAKIERALPDALDLIVVCVEAGNALEQAIAAVTRRSSGPLAEELQTTLAEISLGKTRREALRDLSERVGSRDLKTFIASIIQADRLGVSIGQTLRVQSDAARTRRRQRAEELAAQLPVKMLIPLVLFIFPSVLVVILGPAAVRIAGFLSTLRPPGH
jgi:tight adherence protein C